MRVLVFDVIGEYAHYRKFYTTSSPMTFSVPTPTAIYGMLGAILGYQREEYISLLNNYNPNIAIGINKTIKKRYISTNWIELAGTGPHIKRVPLIRQEFLKDCSYRIYITAHDNLIDILNHVIRNHKCVYTPYLGIAQCIATIEFVMECYGEVCEASTNTIIHSILPDTYSIIVEPGKYYRKETLPVFMQQDRQVINYQEIILEITGNNIIINEGRYIKCGNMNVVFLMPWT